jgi:hypothetical protein
MDDREITSNLAVLNDTLKKIQDLADEKVSKLSSKRLDEIFRMIRHEGRSVVEIGLAIAPELKNNISTYASGVVGSLACVRSLEQKGEYDPIYRPRPARDFMGTIDELVEVYYLPHLKAYELVFGDLRESFTATYVPTFGIDVGDMEIIYEIADKMIAKKV